MGTVPDAYYEFVMHYAPYFYVIPTVLAADPPAGQKNVTVADGSKFQAGFLQHNIAFISVSTSRLMSISHTYATTLASTIKITRRFSGSINRLFTRFIWARFWRGRPDYRSDQTRSLQNLIFDSVKSSVD